MQSAAAVSETLELAGGGQPHSVSNQSANAYLRAIRDLEAEICLATGAITRNRPVEFLESTHRQESLLPELIALGKSRRKANVQVSLEALAFEVSEIEQAELSLWNSIRTYSALLQRSAHSVLLLARLHSSFAAEYPRAGQPNRTRMTWSCEG